MAIKVGDVVALKSGGPSMTVAEVGEYDMKCQWFDGLKLVEGWFPEMSVEASSPKK